MDREAWKATVHRVTNQTWLKWLSTQHTIQKKGRSKDEDVQEQERKTEVNYSLYTWELVETKASPVAQRLKHLPPKWDTWVQSLRWEDPLEKEMAPTPVFLPGETHGRRSLVGYSPRGLKESDTTEWLHFKESREEWWQLTQKYARLLQGSWSP